MPMLGTSKSLFGNSRLVYLLAQKVSVAVNRVRHARNAEFDSMFLQHGPHAPTNHDTSLSPLSLESMLAKYVSPPHAVT